VKCAQTTIPFYSSSNIDFSDSVIATVLVAAWLFYCKLGRAVGPNDELISVTAPWDKKNFKMVSNKQR